MTQVRIECGYLCRWWGWDEVSTTRARSGHGYPCGWWDGDEFKYIPARAVMGLEFFLSISSRAGMKIRILCECGMEGPSSAPASPSCHP